MAGFLRTTLGPGLLFAGAAVGVSHLVQSTRAGAEHGVALLLVVIAANVVKYPAFSFGPRYAAATGTSLLEGYRRRGVWALALYGLLTLGTMFTVQAAVTIVTAAILKALFELEQSPFELSVGLLLSCAGILAIGHYRWLDRLMKIVVSALTIMTVVATVLVLPRIDWSSSGWLPTGDHWNLLFIAALVGWMPSAIDISVWHSLWTLAKRRDTKHAPSVRDSMLDFKIGYFGTALLAVCFLLLGAGVVYGTGATMPGSAGGFANRVIDLYASTLGDWSRPLIGGCALMVMFSTTLTVVDGFPRAIAALIARFASAEEAGAGEAIGRERASYWLALVVMFAGSVVLLRYFLGEFTTLIDVATTISCLTAPLLAMLNHRAIFGAEVDAEHQPGVRMRWFSLVCIGLLALLAVAWIQGRYMS
ncbi:MAG TPA: divalent metal cation transporter [Kofleriaceae bacterium]|nr:divalent metal cation transporter [Kofleriaceae bacterium]